jgi:hypothetical protein
MGKASAYDIYLCMALQAAFPHEKTMHSMGTVTHASMMKEVGFYEKSREINCSCLESFTLQRSSSQVNSTQNS